MNFKPNEPRSDLTSNSHQTLPAPLGIISGRQSARHNLGRIRFGSVFPALMVAGTALISCAGYRATAGQFPSPGENETTQSMGVFQVTVDSSKLALMNPGTGSYSAYTFQYFGWNPAASSLTSPALYDASTAISVSAAHQREINLPSSPPTYFPVTVGDATGTLGVDYDMIGTSVPGPDQYYNDYIYPVPVLSGAFLVNFASTFASGTGPDEVLTEIQEFTLTPTGPCGSNAPPNTPQIPPPNSIPNVALVRAGYANSYNGPGGTSLPNYLRQSIGMVQSRTRPLSSPSSADFPADSFFNIYAEFTLPPVPGSVSSVAFPPEGAVLTNEQPLIVTATNIDSLPPSVVYYHVGNSGNEPFAVNLRFKYDDALGGVFYHAGDLFGTVVLAGHGLLDPCMKANNLQTFITDIFGQPEQLAPRATTGHDFVDTRYPCTNSVYASVPGTNFQGGSIDAVYYTNGAAFLVAKDFQVSQFASLISLPPPNSSVIYTNANTVVTFKASSDDVNFVSASGIGQMQVLISNTATTFGNASVYSTQLLAFDISGASGEGSFKLRADPTKSSLGQHFVEDNGMGGFKIGGSINAVVDYSFNNGITYTMPTRGINWEETPSPACGPPGPLNGSVSGSSLILSWVGSTFRLQGSTSLSPPAWTDIPGTSPIAVSLTSPTNFYRLICP